MDLRDFVGALGAEGVQRRALLMAAVGSAMGAHGSLGFNQGNSLRLRALGSKAMGLSGYSVGLLAAGALQLERFVSSTSSFLEQFQEPDGNGHQHHKSKIKGASSLHTAIQSSKGFRVPSSLGTSMLITTPWFSLVHFIEDSSNPRSKSKIRMASATAGDEKPVSRSVGEHGSKARTWTNAILGLNLLVFMAQVASHGRLLLWGSKVNSLIDQGQLWRLITPSLLHANIAHLLVNSYSLNSIGPTVESLGGGRRFLSVYTASAVASSGLSYYLCKAPSVGASGAIFGLVGALAVYLVRHKNLLSGGERSLAQVGRVIALNLVFGVLGEGIDNWGHFGGLLGGAAVAWLVGPAFSLGSLPGSGKRFLLDQPPISKLFTILPKQQGDQRR